MVVTTTNQVNTHLGEDSENLLGVLEAVPLGQLAAHRVVVHHDYPRILLGSLLEDTFRLIQLVLMDVTDDGDVAHVPGERAPGDSVRGVEADKSRPRHMQHRLQIPIDEATIVLVDLPSISDAERRPPPFDIMIAGNRDHPAHLLRVANERRRALKFARASPLRKIARDRDYVELAVMDD